MKSIDMYQWTLDVSAECLVEKLNDEGITDEKQQRAIVQDYLNYLVNARILKADLWLGSFTAKRSE
jgi:hypothetical protein